jgi:hypothetical protein
MSIASETSRVDYVGNASTDEYDFTFLIFAEDDLLVSLRDTDDIETTLTLNTDYTVDGIADPDGGTITLTAGNLGSGETLTIRRVRDIIQETDIRNQGEFFPETHEDTFDQLTMVDQQQQDEIDRSIKLPETVAATGFDTALPADITSSPGDVLAVNPDGDGFQFITPVSGTLAGEVAGDLSLTTDGGSIVLTSPDGTKSIRFGLDNDGNFGAM